MTDANRWTKETALAELGRLLSQADQLVGQEPMSEPLVRWILNTQTFLSEVFGEASTYFDTFSEIRWNATPSGILGGGSRPEESFDPELGMKRLRREGAAKNITAAKGILGAAFDYLENRDLQAVYKAKDTGPEASTILRIVNLAERELRKTVRNTPTGEREIQDRFEDLLNGAGLSFQREQERVTYSSKAYTPDFTVAQADLAIEIKFSNRLGREKEIIAEMNDDIMAYKQRWGNLIFVIYDVGSIRDVDRLCEQFETSGTLVRIVKH